MANSFTFNGTDLSTLGLQLSEYSIPEMANVISGDHTAIFGDTSFTTINHSKREISLECSVTASSQATLQTNIDLIKGILNPILADKVFSIDDDINRRYIGRVVSMSAPTAKGRWGVVFTVGMVSMGHKQALAETNASIAITTNPDTLEITAVSGNVSRTPAEFYVRNLTAGDLVSLPITIANDTTNESITWTGTLEQNRWLKFGTLDAQGRFSSTIEKSVGTGADPEAETYSDVELGYTSGDWLRLKGGVNNDITVTGIGTGTLEWTYRGRYL